MDWFDITNTNIIGNVMAPVITSFLKEYWKNAKGFFVGILPFVAILLVAFMLGCLLHEMSTHGHPVLSILSFVALILSAAIALYTYLEGKWQIKEKV